MIEIEGPGKILGLSYVDRKGKRRNFPFLKKRILIGSSELCDVTLPFHSVSSVHCLVEIRALEVHIYDLNSEKGTSVQGKKIVHSLIAVGETIKLGDKDFDVLDLARADRTPPVLKSLDRLPPTLNNPVNDDAKASTTKSISSDSAQISKELPRVPTVSFPLASDPLADKVEYIFEDASEIYPVFQFEKEKTAVEVIILFKGLIQSVDYLPKREGVFSLVGLSGKKDDIIFPYLGKNDKVPFVEISSGRTTLHDIPGMNRVSYSEDDKKGIGSVELVGDELYRFEHENLQILVRGVESPPKVKPAPFFRRDKELKKYLAFFFIIFASFLGGLSLIEIDKEKEEDKAPERLAKILQQRKLIVTKKRGPITEKKKKKLTPKRKRPDVVKKKAPKVSKTKKAVGVKTSKAKIVKKATPNKGKKNRIKDLVAPKSRPKKTKSTTAGARAKGGRKGSKGRVDVYKSNRFKSSLSNLLAKGGGGIGKGRGGLGKGDFGSSVGSSGLNAEGATLKKSKVSGQIGSLSGTARGTVDARQGVDGIVNKKGISVLGVPSRTVVLGSMDPNIIRQILIDHLPQFRYCYQKELDTRKSAFDGQAVLDFVIGASGHVAKASVIKTKVPPTVGRCVTNVLRGIKFPAPRGGGRVAVTQPLNFNASSY